jgi:hypothetical protein
MRDGKLLFIAAVARGLACECVCAKCGRLLIAKKGAIRQHHFSHIEITDCQGAAESVLHLLSKELLSELDSVVIPPYEFVKQRKMKTGTIVQYRTRVAKGGRVPVSRVKVEVHEEGFVPDIIVESGSKSLIVEVAVSHRVNRAKLRRIRKRDLPAIEINLDANDSFLPRDLLRTKLQCDLASKIWLFHPAQREAERAFLAKWRDSIAQDRMRRAMRCSRTPTSVPFRSMSHLATQPPLSDYDRTANEFHTTHGRYPTVEECLELWPHLWKR